MEVALSSWASSPVAPRSREVEQVWPHWPLLRPRASPTRTPPGSPPTVVELPSSFCLERGGTAYLILEKALYDLRSASLSWQRHLSKIMVGLGLKASPLEPTLFSGWVQLGQKWTYIIALAYVDDLLIVSDSQEGVEFIHKSLSAVLKVKVTGRLHEDGQLEFLGRLIKLDGNNEY